MKKFVVKFILFSIPIAFLFLFTTFFYATDKGDLIRVGYLIEKKNYRAIFEKEFNQPILFSKVSEISLNQQQKFKVLTIGDSFSEQFAFGYKNYLAQNNISVLHLDRFLSENPIQTAHGILNGDFLNTITVDCIILQSVERDIVSRAQECNMDTLIGINAIQKKIEKHQIDKLQEKDPNEFSANRLVKFPLQNITYFFDDNAFDSETYKVKTKRELFSVSDNELLFLSTDLDKIKQNNNQKAVFKLNQVLNLVSKKCKQKGIKLIVLPSPDKFDFYYDEILEKQKYPRPLFFEYFEQLPKQYCYINSKKVLRETLKNKKDIYFYDDTHWSPWSSKVLADALQKLISKQDTTTIN